MNVPIIIEERTGIDRVNEPLTVGIPFPKGVLLDPDALALRDQDSRLLPLQTQVMDRWSDQSCRWVLVDFQTTIPAMQKSHYSLELLDRVPSESRLIVNELADAVEVATGPAAFRVSKDGPSFPFKEIVANGNSILAFDSPGMVLVDANGRTWQTELRKVAIETSGPCARRFTLKDLFPILWKSSRWRYLFPACIFFPAMRQ